VDPKKAEDGPAYFLETNNRGKIQKVKSLDTGHLLGKPSDLLASFENPDYIHAWYDEAGDIQRIDLPRFNLSFRPSGQHFLCAQFPGFRLNTSDPVKQLGGALPLSLVRRREWAAQSASA